MDTASHGPLNTPDIQPTGEFQGMLMCAELGSLLENWNAIPSTEKSDMNIIPVLCGYIIDVIKCERVKQLEVESKWKEEKTALESENAKNIEKVKNLKENLQSLSKEKAEYVQNVEKLKQSVHTLSKENSNLKLKIGAIKTTSKQVEDAGWSALDAMLTKEELQSIDRNWVQAWGKLFGKLQSIAFMEDIGFIKP